MLQQQHFNAAPKLNSRKLGCTSAQLQGPRRNLRKQNTNANQYLFSTADYTVKNPALLQNTASIKQTKKIKKRKGKHIP